MTHFSVHFGLIGLLWAGPLGLAAEPDRAQAIADYCRAVARKVVIAADGRDAGMSEAQQLALQATLPGGLPDPALWQAATARVYRDRRPGAVIAAEVADQCRQTLADP